MTRGARSPRCNAAAVRRSSPPIHCATGSRACPDGRTPENRIEKTFHFADYHRTMAFVNAVATVAHAEDHHPDLAVHYDRCTVAWSTHSAHGVTLNDCICAAKVEALAA